MKDVVDVLKEAHGYISQGWTKREFARDRLGSPVGPNHPEAAFWCIRGAVMKATDGLADPFFDDDFAGMTLRVEGFRVLMKAAGIRDVSLLVPWNDDPDRTKDQVLEVFTKAIESANVPRSVL